jgi:hypothetical protein
MLTPRYGILFTIVPFRIIIGENPFLFLYGDIFELLLPVSESNLSLVKFFIVIILPNKPADFGIWLNDCNFLGLFFSSLYLINFSFASASF